MSQLSTVFSYQKMPQPSLLSYETRKEMPQRSTVISYWTSWELSQLNTVFSSLTRRKMNLLQFYFNRKETSYPSVKLHDKYEIHQSSLSLSGLAGYFTFFFFPPEQNEQTQWLCQYCAPMQFVLLALSTHGKQTGQFLCQVTQAPT